MTSMNPSQEPVALIVDNGKILAITGPTADATGIQQVTSWQQARDLAGDRGLTYDDLTEIEAVFGPQ